jgi:hypothetical protein
MIHQVTSIEKEKVKDKQKLLIFFPNPQDYRQHK